MSTNRCIPLLGKLEKIILSELSYKRETTPATSAAKATISTQIEVGVKSDYKEYFASVATDVNGVSESGDNIYSARCVILAFYKSEDSLEEHGDKMFDYGSERAAMQVYPLVRNELLDLIRKNGGVVKNFPLEPIGLEEKPGQESKKKIKKPRTKSKDAL